MGKRIAVVGVGALGGYVGGWLAHTGEDVTLIDFWPENIETIRKNGLELESVSLTSLDQTSKEFFNPNNAFDAEGLTAVCVQHEMDHLAGKLFVDYLSPLKREMVRKKLAKQRRQQTDAA